MTLLERGKIDESRMLSDGSKLEFERIYPLDAEFDTLADAPEDVRANKRYKEHGDFIIQGLAERLDADFGEHPLDIVVHSLANGPEVKKPLLETSRKGYLDGGRRQRLLADRRWCQRLGPLMRPKAVASSRSRTWRASG